VSLPSLFLAPGGYTIQIKALFDPANPGPITFRLRGDALSDPIGPALGDPTLTPLYTSPTAPSVFVYPAGVVLPDPFVFVLIDPSGPLVGPLTGDGTDPMASPLVSAFLLGPNGMPVVQ